MRAFSQIRNLLRWMWDALRREDFRTAFLLVSVVLIQILSYYLGSKRFFRTNLMQYFGAGPLLNLYEHMYWFSAEFVLEFLLPVILIVLVFRQSVARFGVTRGDVRLGTWAWLASWVVMLPVLWVVSSFESFQQTYPHARVVRTDWFLFVLYEAVFFLYMLGWEFIWRGYMLFGLKERLGSIAVFIQMIPFVLLHFGKPLLETFGAVVGGLLLGYLALRTGSFLYGVLIHWSVMVTIDLLATLRFRSQVFGVNPLNLYEILSKSL